MIYTILFIGCGGAFGAIARYGLNEAIIRVLGSEFPWGIMIVNIIGSVVMGILTAFFVTTWSVSQDVRLFATVGFLGGFTTFSSFSLDTINLWLYGNPIDAFTYVFGSMLLSVAGLFVSYSLIMKFLGS